MTGEVQTKHYLLLLMTERAFLKFRTEWVVKQKMLKGLRGKGGGYQLTRTPAEYSVGEILEVAEGTLAPVACLMDDAEDCPRANQCRTLPMWKKFDSLVHDFFYNITLEQILEDSKFLPEE